MGQPDPGKLWPIKTKQTSKKKRRRTHRAGWKIEFGQYKSKRTSEGIRPGIIFLSIFG